MKKTIFIVLLCDIILIGLVECTQSEIGGNYIGEESTVEIATDSDVTLSIKEGTLTNTGATIVLTNTSNKEYVYGEPYSIQIKKDGVWHVINVQRIFETPLLHLKNGETKEIELNWKGSYGELENGTYRIIKGIDYEYEENKYESFRVAVEFHIDH